MRVVEQQVDLPAGLIDGAAADSAVIAILVDEALTRHVDEHAAGMAFGHRPRAGGEELLHVDGIATRAHAEFDAHAIVLVADRAVDPETIGAILAPHRLVHHEAAGGEHHAFRGADETVAVVDPHDRADDAVPVFDQCHGARIDHDLHLPIARGAFEDIDQRTPAAPTLVLDHVAARCGFGSIAERRRCFAARPDQR